MAAKDYLGRTSPTTGSDFLLNSECCEPVGKTFDRFSLGRHGAEDA